jgi:hypothetical protein
MDGFAHMQIEMHASIDSQTSMMHELFGHFEIMLKSCKDLNLGRCRVPRYESALVSFCSKLFLLSHHLSWLLVLSLPLS